MENKPAMGDNWVLPLSSTLTLSFVQQWRSISGVASRPAKYFDPSGTGYHIAVHFRRGEVSPTIMEMQRYRWLDNAGYINMVQKVLALLPDAEVHIFSTTVDDVTKKQMFASADFFTHLDNLGIRCILMVLRWTIWFICQRLMFLFATKARLQWLQLSSIRSAFYLLDLPLKAT